MSNGEDFQVHSSHWGPYEARLTGDGLEIRPQAGDLDPAPLLENIPGSIHHATRVDRPMVRASWLEDGPGPGPRSGPFVPVSWDEAADLVAGEVRRVIAEHGNSAIFGGSYGWSSAGRFHHAQSHVHRFLNMAGGYVGSRATYSAGAAEIFFPHVVAGAEVVARLWHEWEDIVENTELVLAFGGLPRKNNFVASGGIAEHRVDGYLRQLGERGATVVNLSPLRDDYPPHLESTWVPVRPFGDVPLMLAMCWVLVTEGRHDREFLDRYTVGFEQVRRYLLGEGDGVPKDPAWAAPLCGVPADEIIALARRAAESRTLINTTHSLQRSQHGEQPLWAALTLACLLGQVGLPGRGYAYSLGSMGNNGAPPMAFPIPAMPQGANPVRDFIPVARISDLLLGGGQTYDYNGDVLTYPDIRMVYWAGGNPFHHHQDLFRLREAFSRPDTVVVHEQYWTSTARLADIVLPATITLERRDIGAGRHDRRLIAMNRVTEPHGEAKDDYEIFAMISERLGLAEEYTEGRTSEQWLESLYETLSASMSEVGVEPPTWAEFWSDGGLAIPPEPREGSPIELFRRDPEAHRLPTPSGRIELYSERIASFEYDDCWGHAAWFESSERVTDEDLADGWLQLLANNPATRLHSQLDPGSFSQGSKVAGREPVRLHPQDAAARGIGDGDVVMLSNARGACLAGAVLSEAVRPGVVQLSTGAWFEPVVLDGREVCVHGNPNVLAVDVGTSKLTQGCSGQLSKVRVSRHEGAEVPEVSVTRGPPEVLQPSRDRRA
ncbi:molybdopterin oxidoreductase [Nocardioides marmoriginsengisoli]|uniref:Molybdopterin oxidoreductase n=1 Tax=Nocardioides marmoriginsengisoli TaxID=661483 RepID=A0A3N0CB53_9ACTN|nr:molybdopterin-dependent oxidoreductase [Nocardioides marmoriginsengisoli]RNL60670.1 molybdopterin oxidoreductase [Nocardioides marmoriginsengisoli]